MSWFRPWTKLIVRYPDGIEVWLTYTGSSWSLHGQYLEDIPIANLETEAEQRISTVQPLIQQTINDLTGEAVGPKQPIVDFFYSNKIGKNVDTRNIPKDGIPDTEKRGRVRSFSNGFSRGFR